MTRAQAASKARNMFLSGWPVSVIERELRAQGINVSKTTFRRWADPAFEQKRKNSDRDQKASRRARNVQGALGRHDQTTAYKQVRMQAMADAGLGPAGIAIMLRLDFGDEFTEKQITVALARGRYPSEARIGRPPVERKEVLDLVASGLMQRDVAKVLGISTSTVSRVVRRAA